jgi:hypothetical protein
VTIVLLRCSLCRVRPPGDYFGYNTYAQGCRLWLKLSESTGNHIDYCQKLAANAAVWTGTAIRQPNTNNPKCLPGYFNGWKIVLNAASVRVGLPATIKVIQLDQEGNSMETYDPPNAGTTVSINVVGGTGSLLPSGATSVGVSDGFGTFVIQNDKIESVTFSVTDSNSAPRSLQGPSPTQAFHGPDLTSVLLTAGGANVPFTPPLTPLVYAHTASSTVQYCVSQMVVRAKFTQMTSLIVNGVDRGSLSSDTDSAPFTLNLGVNTIEIVSYEDDIYTYAFSVTRNQPEVTAIDLIASPELASITPAFEAGSLIPRFGAVPGILTTLSVRATFNTVGSLTLVVNGQSFGVMNKDSPIDVTSALHAGANIVQLTSIPDGGTFTYTLETSQSIHTGAFQLSHRHRTRDVTV